MSELGVGDAVYIDSFEGFGGPAVIVGERRHKHARFKVRMDDGSQPEFWAHDFEVSPAGPPKEGYDSRPDTRKHIREVQLLLLRVVDDLQRRMEEHDASKLNSPEVEAFDEFTPKLRDCTYGSDEYKGYLAAMKPALDHHYKANDHHPEFHADGIRGMSLLQVVEMLMDWWAASKRHADGCVYRSIEISQARFGYSDELKSILVNTIKALENTPPLLESAP